MSDIELIERLGGPAKLARRLGYATPAGTRRVANWKKRGIPAQVRLDNPRIFKAATRAVRPSVSKEA